jgi:diadenosine tetraphosphatase ApaH/serine/threonine PP2A family protein phosphatase
MSLTDAHTAPRLRAEHRAWLAALPATLRFSPEVLLCHGTPTSDLRYFLETVVPGFRHGIDAGVRRASLAEAAERAGDALLGVPHALILCGHTHVARAMWLDDGRLVVNPGSVGLQAFDDDHGHPHVIENATPHARYAVLTRTPAGWNVELRAIAYDHEAAARQADFNGRPDWADALRTGFVGRMEPA